MPDLAKAVETATTLESALYLQSTIEILLKKSRPNSDEAKYLTSMMDTVSDKISHLQMIADYLDGKYEGDLERVEERRRLSENYHLAQAKKAMYDLKIQKPMPKMDVITFVYDINDNGFLRGYMQGNRFLDSQNEEDQQIISVVDKVFHGWLVQNKLLSKNGSIYEAQPVDEQGNPINKISPDKFNVLLNDPENGFERAIRNIDRSINVNIVRERQAPQPIRSDWG